MKRATSGTRNGEVSFWYRDDPVTSRRAPLPHDVTVDVAIVGAGLTGLWTAYYLKRARPDLHIVVIEREFAGFGASGRNGGWLSAELAGSRERYAAVHGRDGVVQLLAAMRDAVDKVIAVTAHEGIEADIVKDGMLLVARSEAQRARLRHEVEHERSWGAGSSDIHELTAAELGRRINVPSAVSAAFTPHCARVQPAKLVRGLARVVEAQGTVIYESTEATAVSPHRVTTTRGTVTAKHIVQCLEGFTAGLRGQRRAWLPMNSSMIVTEPLPDTVMDQVGWHGSEVLGDSAHAYLYAQRTADGRIALGGRGNPYRFASRTDDHGRTQAATVESLTATLHALFPATVGLRIEHAWCGVLAVPRDWCTTVNYDRGTGIGLAGGYVGSGLTTTNLAGRTLADLVLDEDSALTRLPWVNRRMRRWEPEPLRWIGVQAMYALYRAADHREENSHLGATSRWARLANAISGR
nr:FAD-dependent oxidoreductase [Streptomyces ossamyceticus]